MPFYEYECASCKYYTEIMQKISDKPLTKCPSCGKNQLKKLISAPNFRLKGGGWYETDFKSEGENKRNLADDGGKDDSAAESKSDAKSDDKSKAKSEGKPAKKAAKPVAKPKPARKPAAKPAAKKAKRKTR